MRAVAVTASRAPGNIVLADQPDPVPKAGEVAIDVVYAGCNWGDTMILVGSYPHPISYPFTPGWEVAGQVASVGSGVLGVSVGDRVAAYLPDGGGYAERCVAVESNVIPLPREVSIEKGAAFPVQALTAWHVVHTIGAVKAGDVVLIHAIGGGLGLYATQFAVAAGARVVGTIGTAGKERLALEFGAAQVIHRAEKDFVEATLEMTGGTGVDLVIDSLGGATLDRSFDAVRLLGRVVSIGEAEGTPLPTLWSRLVPRSLTFSRFHLDHVGSDTPAWRRGIAEVIRMLSNGSLRAPIAGVYPLEEAGAMLARLRSRQVAGKLLLSVLPGDVRFEEGAYAVDRA